MARKRKPASPLIVEEVDEVEGVEEVEEEEVEEEEEHISVSSGEEGGDGEENEDDEDEDDEGEEDEDDEGEEDEGEEGEEDEEEEDEEEEDDEEELEGDEDEENNQVEGVEEDFSSKESIIKLLEPFRKDQLIEIFKGAAVANSSLVSRVVDAADTDPIHRNIFVHGLSSDVTSETLSVVFSRFGKIDKCTAVIDQATGKCKGFGFILFQSRAAAQNALKEPLKIIGNRTVSCHLAALGNPAASKNAKQQAPSAATGRKIFVNNIGSNIKPESLLAFFSKFGEIERGPLGGDKETGKLRGFALFYYKTVEGCNKALEEPTKYFEGCMLQCERALPGSQQKQNDLIQYVVPTKSVPVMAQTNDFSSNYASAAPLMRQNLVSGPTAAGVSPAFNRGVTGIPPFPYAVGSVGSVGSTNRGSGMGVNSISPSVIANYGSLAAHQGLGAYYSTPDGIVRSGTGVGSFGASGFPPFR